MSKLLLQPTGGFILEFCVLSTTLCVQSYTLRQSQDRQRSFPSSKYHKWISRLHLALFLSNVLSLVLSCLVYPSFPDDYTSLFLDPTLGGGDGALSAYTAYRVISTIQKVVFNIALFLLAVVQFNRFSPALLKVSRMKVISIIVKAFYIMGILITLAFIIYTQISVSNWQQTYQNGGMEAFMELQGFWGLVVGMMDWSVGVASYSACLNWGGREGEVDDLTEEEYVWTSSTFEGPITRRKTSSSKDEEEIRYDVSLSMKFLLLLDFVQFLLMSLLLVLSFTLFTDPRDRMIVEKALYLSMSLHFILSSFYLDVSRQVLQVYLKERSSTDTLNTGKGDTGKNPASKIIDRDSLQKSLPVYTYTGALGNIDQLLEEYFEVEPTTHAPKSQNAFPINRKPVPIPVVNGGKKRIGSELYSYSTRENV